MNDHLHRMYFKIEEAAQGLMTLLAGFEPIDIKWSIENEDTIYVLLGRDDFDKWAHPDSCRVIEHTEDRDGVEGLFYELQWGMSELLTFCTYITQEEYEKIRKDKDDIPF